MKKIVELITDFLCMFFLGVGTAFAYIFGWHDKFVFCIILTIAWGTFSIIYKWRNRYDVW